MTRRLSPGQHRAARTAVPAVALVLLLAVLVAAAAPAPAAPARAAAPVTAARAAILIDRVTGRVLWSQQPDLRLPMASTTKIMTLLIVLERRRDRLDESFVVSDEVAGSTGVGLQPGDTITYRSAITGMIVRSATDASIALAADVAGTEDRFVVLMNRRAKAWGMKRTHFTNSSGAPEDRRHVSTARDLAALGRRAMREPEVRDVVTVKEAVVSWETGVFACHSNNWILRYPWGQGIKPGYTPMAKYCLVAAGQPGLRPLISVTLHEPTRPRNMAVNAALLQYGSSLYHRVSLVRAGDVVARRSMPDGSVLTCVAGSSLTGVVVRKGAVVRRTLSLLPRSSTPPVAGDHVGSVTYRADGEVLGVAALSVAAPSPPRSAVP